MDGGDGGIRHRRDERAAAALDRVRAGSSAICDDGLIPGRGFDRVGTIASTLRRRLEHLSTRARVVITGCAVAMIGLSIGAVSVAVFAGGVSGTDDTAPVGDPTSSAPVVTSTPASVPGLVVHASGAVRTPGVYRLDLGARVIDLLEAAGGPGDGLDLDRLNLASPLTDGSRIWFPVRGERAPVVEVDPADSNSPSAAPVDLNRATASQLDALPGVGPSTAAAIVAHRVANGPFRSIDDLLAVKGLGPAKVEALRPLVTVG